MGQKLQVTKQNLSGEHITDYIGSNIYENGSLKRTLIAGGYIEDGQYYYYLTDHLGSTRVVSTASGEVVQTNHYYPYGLTFAEGVDTSNQPYLFNGKEFDRDRSLNLYDYGARFMTPEWGRFTTIDPLSEIDPSVSPYAYCRNNPIRFIDPDGRREWPVNATYNGHARRHENNYLASRPNGRLHQGVDINLGNRSDDLGAPVYATHDGKVTRVVAIDSGDKNAGGNRVQIESPEGEVSTSYMHLDAIDPSLKEGSNIAEGTQIGIIGGSGNGVSDRYAPHLHYEMKINGQQADPTAGATRLKDPQLLLTPQNGGIIPTVVVTRSGIQRLGASNLNNTITPPKFDPNVIR